MELAVKWGLSRDTIVRLFRDEPGMLRIFGKKKLLIEKTTIQKTKRTERQVVYPEAIPERSPTTPSGKRDDGAALWCGFKTHQRAEGGSERF
jgi:hypothetical protein